MEKQIKPSKDLLEETLLTPVLPPAESWHVAGRDCAGHFLVMLTEGEHRARLDVLREDGSSDEQICLSLLKTALDSDIWHAAQSFMEESGQDTRRGKGDVLARPCLQCQLEFLPHRTGQRFCCNACAYRAEGISPSVEHEEICTIQRKEAA